MSKAATSKAATSTAKASPQSGLVIVDKPAGWTSHDVVAKVRRLAGTRRVGHAGTLDPMATGVLVVGVEKATRLLGHLTLTEKEYLATIRLGQATDTGDAEGTVTAAADASGLTLDAVRAAAATLTGPIQQVPPAVSAIKVGGKRSYALTRAGQAPELPARRVTVWSFEVVASRWAVPAETVPAETVPAKSAPAKSAPAKTAPAKTAPAGDMPAGDTPAEDGAGADTTAARVLDVDVSVRCSSGTYVRALARDLGEALGAGGHLTMLRRTRVGPYDLGLARTLDELATTLTILPIGQAAAAAFPARHLTQTETEAVSHGRRLPASGAAGTRSGSGGAGTRSGDGGAGTRSGDGGAGTRSGDGAAGTRSGSGAAGTRSGSGGAGTRSGGEPACASGGVPDEVGAPAEPAPPAGAPAEPAPPAGAPAEPAPPAGTSAPGSAPIAAFAPDGTFVALLEEKDGQARPLAVFA